MKFGVFNRGLRRLPDLSTFVGGEIVQVKYIVPSALDATLGWGRRKFSRQARRVAAAKGIPYICIEDGFLRSVDLGKSDPPLSLVVDETGIYYDATAPSQLEKIILGELAPEQIKRAQRVIAAWRSSRVSKYNHAREYNGSLPSSYVLVADQTLGDASIQYGMADIASFHTMLNAALSENPDCTVLLKVHPEVAAGRKKGHFDLASVAGNPRIQMLSQDVHPVSLIENARAVYAVTSQIGFEGILWGKKVRTFGMPFYAGWGLSEDQVSAPVRRRPVLLENLVHAALVDYPRYRDPETGKRCDVERLIDWMGLQRRMRERFPSQIYAQGFSRWKRPIVRSFFQGSTVRFVRDARRVPQGTVLAVWGRKPIKGRTPIGARDSDTVRLEDGFLRSVGLGADLVRPLSWVIDGRGMYYDATCPSDLEHILQTSTFDEMHVIRARTLREKIVAHGLTKYNVGASGWQRNPTGQRVILVPGQVESDASILFGSQDIQNNLDLLRTVRKANPDAYIMYKPHPDVVARLRRKGVGENDAKFWCDEIVTDVRMDALLDAVDEVHVLTSLAGFEALLRNKKVVTYGQPFYAGWGLTHDTAPMVRRTRKLSCDELVAGVLIEYPVYVSRVTGRFTTPERALEELLIWREQGQSRMPWWRMLLRIILRFGGR